MREENRDMKKMFYARFLLLMFFISIINGCGEGDTVTAPYGSVIQVQPASVAIVSGGAPTYSDNYFTITVVDKFGKPMNGIELFIDYTWAVPDPGTGYIILYDNNVPVNAPMKVVTDDSGSYHLRIEFLHGGYEYSGDIQVVSAGAEQGYIEFAVSVPS